jgi:hypothetical protein
MKRISASAERTAPGSPLRIAADLGYAGGLPRLAINPARELSQSLVRRPFRNKCRDNKMARERIGTQHGGLHRAAGDGLPPQGSKLTTGAPWRQASSPGSYARSNKRITCCCGGIRRTIVVADSKRGHLVSESRQHRYLAQEPGKFRINFRTRFRPPQLRNR